MRFVNNPTIREETKILINFVNRQEKFPKKKKKETLIL